MDRPKYLKHDTLWDISKVYYGATDKYMDGFTQWGYKQDLWLLKFYVDECLDKCSNFVGEDEWLEEIEKKKMWSMLKQRER